MINKNNKEIMTIIIPTYNHKDYIEYIFSCLKNIDLSNFIIAIHDSSVDYKTQEYISNIHMDNLEYYRYDSSIVVDEKIYLAVQHVNTKYVYLCGDGVVFNFEHRVNEIIRFMENDYDLIEIYDGIHFLHKRYFDILKDTYGKNVIEYNDLNKYLIDNYWHLPFFGGSIVKKEMLLRENQSDIYGFNYPYKIASSLNECSKIVVLGGDFLLQNICRKKSTWVSGEKPLDLWTVRFPNSIKKLDSSKYHNDIILKSSIKNTRFFTFYSLCFFRAYGCFNRKIYKKYKEHMKELGISILKVNIVLLIPVFLLRIVKKIKKGENE